MPEDLVAALCDGLVPSGNKPLFEPVFTQDYITTCCHLATMALRWLVARLAPSHYLNQWWNIVNWTIGNKL